MTFSSAFVVWNSLRLRRFRVAAPVTGQRDVVFDLLDSMSSRGQAILSLRGEGGETRQANLSVTDAGERRRLSRK